MADFSYTIGVDVDSSGIDAFIQKIRGLASGANFGSGFQLPGGVAARGPGVAGPQVSPLSGQQAVGFSQALQTQSMAALAAAKQRGAITADEYKVGKRQVDNITNALLAGARKFEQVLAGVKGRAPNSVELEDASRQSRVAVARDLQQSEVRDARNARRREARAAEKAAKQAEAGLADVDKDAQARREKTQAHRREAAAAKKSAAQVESSAAQQAAANAQKRAEERRTLRDIGAAGKELGIDDDAIRARLEEERKHQFFFDPAGAEEEARAAREEAARKRRETQLRRPRRVNEPHLFERADRDMAEADVGDGRVRPSAQADVDKMSLADLAEHELYVRDTADILRKQADHAARALQDEQALYSTEKDINGSVSRAARRRLQAKESAATWTEREAKAAEAAALHATETYRREEIRRAQPFRSGDPGFDPSEEASIARWLAQGQKPQRKIEFSDPIPYGVGELDRHIAEQGLQGVVPSEFEATIAHAQEAERSARALRQLESYKAGTLGFGGLLNRLRGPEADPSITGKPGFQLSPELEATAKLAASRTIKNFERGVITSAEMHHRLEEINEDLRAEQVAAEQSKQAAQKTAAKREFTAAEMGSLGQAAREEAATKKGAAQEARNLAELRARVAEARAAGRGPAPAGGAGQPPPPIPPKRRIGGADDDEPDRDKTPRQDPIAIEARDVRKKELEALKKRLALVNTSTKFDADIARTKGEILVAEQRIARQERQQAQIAFQGARDSGFFDTGTRTQRLLAAQKSRGGQIVDPETQPRIGQLIGQRFVQASSFAVGGLAFYGALQLLRDTIKESEALERQFAVVRGQIERTFGDQSAEMFEKFKERVRDISKATGQLGSEVALVLRQLSAAFVPTQANPGETKSAFEGRQATAFELAGENAEQAAKFAEVTGLANAEITDSLTAIGLSFDELDGDFRPILDRAIQLEEEFGVLGGQIITFTADLAPLAANLGFTAQQLEEVGAAAQKFSGRSGGQLSEQYGRIFTDASTKAADLLAVFSQTPQLADLSAGLAEAFVDDNISKVLQFILIAANRVRTQNLDPGLTQKISDVVAGRREGASFAAILREPAQLLAALQDENTKAAGAVDARWNSVRDALAETMERLRRAVEQLATALLSAGLVDALTAIVGGATLVVTAVERVIHIFDLANDATGGWAGTLAGLYVLIKSVTVGLEAMAASRVLGLLAPGLAAGAGGLASRLPFGRAAGAVGAHFAVETGAHFAATTAASGGLRAAAAAAAARATTALGAFTPSALAAGGGLGAARFLLPVARALPVIGAVVATKQAIDTAKALRQAVAEQGTVLRAQLQNASALDLLTATASAHTDTRFLGGTPLAVPGTQVFGRTFTGDLPEDILPEGVAAKYGAAGLSDALVAVNRSTKLSGTKATQFAEAATQVDLALQGEEADLESVVKFLSDLGESDSVLNASIAQSLDASLELRVAAETAQQSVANLEQLLGGLEAGRTTPAAVKAALAAAVAPLQEMADAFLNSGDYAGYLTQLELIAGLEDKANKGLSAYAINTAGFAEKIRGILGQSTPETRVTTILAALNDPNVTDDDTRLELLGQLQQGREELFQKRLDAVASEVGLNLTGSARDSARARATIALLEQGVGVDPVAQTESIYQQINSAAEARRAIVRERAAKAKRDRTITGDITDRDPVTGHSPTLFAALFEDGSEDTAAGELSDLRGLTKEAIARISEQLQADIKEYGEGAIEIRLGLLQARANDLGEAIRFANQAGLSDLVKSLSAQRKQVLADLGVYQGLEATGLDPEDIVLDDGGPTPEQVEAARVLREAEADKARAHARALREAQFDLQRARAAGDPVAEAAIGVAAAQSAIANAEDDVAAVQAQAQLVTALQAQDAAFDDITQAQLELAGAKVAQDPLESAKNALRQADLAVAQAKGTAERLRAEAQRTLAQNALTEAIQDIVASQVDLAVALAEAGGDVVEAARLRVGEAVRQLGLAKKTGDDAAINRARGELAGAQRAYNDSILNKQQGDIQFALEMGNITTRQAIESYQQLMTIPTNTEEQNRELQLIIKRLQGELQQDFQYNLPTQLGLPTSYEVNRVNQGGGGYNDYRVITVTVQAETNASPNDIASAVVAVMGEPHRNGSVPKRYY